MYGHVLYNKYLTSNVTTMIQIKIKSYEMKS